MTIIKQVFKNKWIRRFGFPVTGAILGFCYYLIVGCPTNTCPITSNPFVSTAYGAIMGSFLSLAIETPLLEEKSSPDSKSNPSSK